MATVQPVLNHKKMLICFVKHLMTLGVSIASIASIVKIALVA